MTYRDAFPDFPVDSLPAIPEGWEDTSWHNDACPSWRMPTGLRVYVDYPNAEDREFPDSLRFSVSDDDGANFYHGDEWSAALKAAEGLASQLGS